MTSALFSRNRWHIESRQVNISSLASGRLYRSPKNGVRLLYQSWLREGFGFWKERSDRSDVVAISNLKFLFRLVNMDMQYIEKEVGMSANGAPLNPSVRHVVLNDYVMRVPAVPLVNSIQYRFLKRTADIAIATVALLLFLPVILITMLLIWLEDRGPLLYFQTRVGICGQGFRFFKFRSMHVNADKILAELKAKNEAEGAHFKIKGDPRVTKIGRVIRKFSIDEIPQLFCVLAGQMSIVGPRPHLPSEVACYVSPQEARLLVKPGLLCLREIRGRSELNFEDWVSSDIEYVLNRSLWLDLKIFILAFPAVITARGAY